MRKALIWAVVLGLLGAVAAFLSAPFFAFHALRSAAEAEDVQGLTQLVDFDAVRTSLQPQLDARPGVQPPAPSILKDPLGAIRRQLEDGMRTPAPRGPQPDDYLTPRALARLTYGAGSDAWRPAAGPDPKLKSAEIAHYGVNRVRFALERPSAPEQVTIMTFERRGPYEWKLVHVGLPAEPASTPAR